MNHGPARSGSCSDGGSTKRDEIYKVEYGSPAALKQTLIFPPFPVPEPGGVYLFEENIIRALSVPQTLPTVNYSDARS